MILLLCLLQGWLIAGTYASLAQDDPLLLSYSEYSDFLPWTEVAGGTDLALSPESDWLAAEDTASVVYPPGDTMVFLSLDEEDAPSYSLISTDPDPDPETWRLDDIVFLNEELNTDEEIFFSELLAATEVDCVSYDGQSISRIRRDNSCPATKPPTDVDQPTEIPEPFFLPPGSNLGRRPGDIHDPKPRPWWSMQPESSDLDFKNCPSGRKGYREYYTCDSGNPVDRWHLGGKIYNLVYVTRMTSSLLSCFDPHKRWCCENYLPNDLGPGSDAASYCVEQDYNPFIP